MTLKPWYATPYNHNLTKKVIVIGAGISGAATAYSLAKRGYSVTLYEKNSSIASGASGNYQAILYSNFSLDNAPLMELSLGSHNYTTNLVKTLLLSDIEYQQCGIIQLAHNTRSLKMQQRLLSYSPLSNFYHLVNNSQMQELSGIRINSTDGIYYPQGIWLSPTKFIHKLLTHTNIKVILNAAVTNLEFNHKEWQIATQCGIIDNAANLVLCNSHLLNQFPQTANLKLHTTRGQTSKIKNSIKLKSIICTNGYITPNLNNYYTLGATFKNSTNLDIIMDEHQENFNNLIPYIPQLATQINYSTIEGKVNLRGHSVDYLPLVGPVADYTQFNQCYKSLALDANYKIATACPYLPGLYVNALFGSKGMLTAPLCSEMIAAYIDNAPFPGSEKLRQALHPNRLWIKQIIRSGEHN
ncbi:MAG: FAD-dependent 5-carboxymethylaminomethyl-2-thiouridine(34) oxidoreductase MnmC [Burkholderiales bacterium]|nr:FAD-dependent 5-carboxymethylaminomethyl-2-thiouridine(34) oxidoreductase MnmC [Burkholderiales bacterium]